MWHIFAVWVAGIFDSFPPYAEICHDTVRKNAALRRVAVMNLKKLSGGATTDGATLNRYAFHDRSLLRMQIAALNPTIILSCGTFEEVLWLLESQVPDDANDDANIEQSAIRLTNGVTLLRSRHPARGGGLQPYDQLREVASRNLDDAG